ncbi:MAG: adaptor protein MecA [Clostridia bacterium]|nr:adaptor protein MecA [Clostridia bacterium]
MKIEAIGEEKILVALSDKDMNELDITYDEMDYSNIETRRVIWTILDEAKRSLGKSIDTDGRILIEVTPGDDGGCIMCFTTMPITDYKSKKKLIMKKEAEPLLFKALDENAFLDALKVLKCASDSYKSFEIFSYYKNLYFVIYPKITGTEKISYILSDFGDIFFGENELLSRISEYGKSLKAN